MQYQLEALATCVAVFVYAILRRQRKLSSIRDIPGPANPSWIFGISLGVNLTRLPPCKLMTLNTNPFRTPVVFPSRRGWGVG